MILEKFRDPELLVSLMSYQESAFLWHVSPLVPKNSLNLLLQHIIGSARMCNFRPSQTTV